MAVIEDTLRQRFSLRARTVERRCGDFPIKLLAWFAIDIDRVRGLMSGSGRSRGVTAHARRLPNRYRRTAPVAREPFQRQPMP